MKDFSMLKRARIAFGVVAGGNDCFLLHHDRDSAGRRLE